jgi:hypothetical protein
MEKKGKGPILVTGVGCILTGLCLLVVLGSLAMPSLTDGRASWEEATTLGALPGGICCALSSLILLGGLGWMFVSSRKGAKAP